MSLIVERVEGAVVAVEQGVDRRLFLVDLLLGDFFGREDRGLVGFVLEELVGGRGVPSI